jgi:hypothetical protein
VIGQFPSNLFDPNIVKTFSIKHLPRGLLPG